MWAVPSVESLWVKIVLTPKQEKFCQLYIELGDASAAYRGAYNAEKMKPDTIHVKASQMLKVDKFRIRIEELREEIKTRHKITVDDLIAELEEARQAALGQSNPQGSAAVAATMGKAKLLGMDKQVIEHTGSGLPAFHIVKYDETNAHAN